MDRIIDLAGPDGNAFALLGYAKRWAPQLELDADVIMEEMMSGDYNHLLEVFEEHFDTVCTLINKPEEL